MIHDGRLQCSTPIRETSEPEAVESGVDWRLGSDRGDHRHCCLRLRARKRSSNFSLAHPPPKWMLPLVALDCSPLVLDLSSRLLPSSLLDSFSSSVRVATAVSFCFVFPPPLVSLAADCACPVVGSARCLSSFVSVVFGSESSDSPDPARQLSVNRTTPRFAVPAIARESTTPPPEGSCIPDPY